MDCGRAAETAAAPESGLDANGEWLAYESSSAKGYPDHYGRYLEHYLGGRDWREGWGTEGWEEAQRPDTFG